MNQHFGDIIIYQAPKTRIPLQRPPRAEHFQDRKDDLAQLLVDLQPGQVITICGPGGMGKSALAAEALWHLAPASEPPPRFPDGILFHSFYGQRQVALALEHIARSFGEELRPTPKEAAQRALAGLCVLLLLDGTEEADDLRPLLDIRNQCGVLITSRTRKDVVAARQDLLPLPPDDAVTLLQAWGGVRAANREIAQAISHLLGRLPLALRLVGRYLAQNEEEASDYLAWLAATPLAALDQGQRQLESIPLLLARSLAQVSEGAHQVLRVVGLLALAPFDEAAIVKALSPSGSSRVWERIVIRFLVWATNGEISFLSERETRQALGELVNYGLVLRQSERYEVSHALIHAYARQQLAPTDERVVRLADYYKKEIEAHKANFAQLHPLRPHIMALLHNASERKMWSVVDSLAWGIDNFLDLQGFWADRITASMLGVTVAQATRNRYNEGVWLSNLGLAYADLGQVEQAIGYYQQALAIAKEISDRRGEGNHLGSLGIAYRHLGQVEQAIGYYQQALTIAKEIGDRRGEGNHLGNLGIAYANLGQVEQAIGYYHQALDIADEIGDRRGEGNRLGNLGIAYRHLGQVEQAIDYYHQALAIANAIGNRRGEGNALGNLGQAFAQQGNVAQAVEFCEQSLAIKRATGDRPGEGEALNYLGFAYHVKGDWQRALALHQQAIAILGESGYRRELMLALLDLGETYFALAQVEQAYTHWQEAQAIALDIGDRYNQGKALENLGKAYRDLGQVEQARQCWEEALALFEQLNLPDVARLRQLLAAL